MGILANIGRATPAIQDAITEMEDRPRRALRWGWEQEQVGQKREEFGQRKALNEMTINKMKAEEETRKEEERLDKAPVPLRTHPFFANFTPEDTEKIIGTGKKLGIVTGEKGNEQTTGRGWKYFQKMARENEDAAVWMSNAKERKLRMQADDAYNQYEKITNDPNATPDKKKKALDTLNTANAQWKGHKEGFEKFINAKRFESDFKTTVESPEFKTMPTDRQNQIVMAGKSAIATGDYDQYYKARDKAFEEAKQITPHWETVQDPKSPTGWSRQDMNNPNAPLRTGAPAPSSAIEKEKTFKDKQIEKMWPTLSEEERKKVVGAGIDPHEVTEKNILDMYGNVFTNETVRKSIQPIAENIIKRATEKPIGKPPSPKKVINELPKGAKFHGYAEDGKKIYIMPPVKSGGKPTYIKEQ